MPDDLSSATLHAIGFATGAALCALLGSMQRRVDRASGAPSGYQLLWAVGVIWTLGRFLRYTLMLAGADADAASVRAAESLSWSCTILGPVAIGLFLQARLTTNAVAARGFVKLTGGVSLLNLALYSWAGATHAFDLDESWYPQTSLCIALALTAVALVLYRLNRPTRVTLNSSQPRWLGRWIVLLATAQIAAALLTIREGWLPPGMYPALTVVSEHWAIPWSVLIAASLAQIHFADIVLKRSLWLLASVAVGTAMSVLVFGSRAGLPTLATTLGCAALLLIAPYLLRAVHWLVDRVVLDRADYVAAASLFEAHAGRLYDPVQLIDSAVQSVRTTLRVDARIVPADDTVAAEAPLASLPIETAHRPNYRLDVSASHRARQLMSQEFEFLNAIRAQIGHRLDLLHFEAEQRALHLREERLKRLLTEAELKALRTQVDPHFLFNTLNTIAELIGTNPGQAEKMTVRLAECFRYALSRHSRDLSTLDDELEFARHYLEIEQVRFGERLHVHLSRGDASGDELIPSLLLQPLLENAIRHGLAPMREGGNVSVVARHVQDSLQLQIDDDGIGLPPDFGKRTGIGLQNVKERLTTLYAKAAEFDIRGRAGGRGTSVTILVPLHAH